MKTNKILRSANDLLDIQAGDSLPKASSLREILEKLARKEAKLNQKLSDASPEKRKKILRKLENLNAQRERGDALLRAVTSKD